MQKVLDRPMRLRVTCPKCGRETIVECSNNVAMWFSCQICGTPDLPRELLDYQGTLKEG